MNIIVIAILKIIPRICIPELLPVLLDRYRVNCTFNMSREIKKKISKCLRVVT